MTWRVTWKIFPIMSSKMTANETVIKLQHLRVKVWSKTNTSPYFIILIS